MFLKRKMNDSTNSYSDKILQIKEKISQGFEIRNGELIKPKGIALKMAVPSESVPKCPKCGRPMSMNLRSDNTFVQDADISSVITDMKRSVGK